LGGIHLEVTGGVQAEKDHSEIPGILFVDDEVNILKALARLFRIEPVRVYTASSSDEAFVVLEKESIQVVVSDQNMPGVRGVQLLQEIRQRWPDVIRMMLTGYTEMNVAVQAINQGEIYRLITKPWNDEELRAIVRQALDSYFMRTEIRRLNDLTKQQNRALQEMNYTLELKVQERTKEVKEKP
jgi:DNA-binding NtrC family response regulator